MAQRALNKVQLIGNLTRDPELRYTPQGTAVCTFGLATNRTWTTETGDKKEDAEFHRIVAWNKLAEICSQLLFKGRRVYLEGRLQTRQWTGKDGVSRQTTEIVISDMIILDSKRSPGEADEGGFEEPAPADEEVGVKEAASSAQSSAQSADDQADDSQKKKSSSKAKKKETETKDAKNSGKDAEVKPEDIPF